MNETTRKMAKETATQWTEQGLTSSEGFTCTEEDFYGVPEEDRDDFEALVYEFIDEMTE